MYVEALTSPAVSGRRFGVLLYLSAVFYVRNVDRTELLLRMW